MPLIYRKVLRSMWEMKMTYLASITVILIGIMCYVALSAVTDRLVTSKDAFYREYNFADVFIRVEGAPKSVLAQIERTEGVAAAEGRLSVSARVITEDRDKIVTLRVYGVDTERKMEDQLNGIKLLGQSISDGRDILLEKPFYDAHGLKEGGTVELSLFGNRNAFTVRGAFNSPEYIYVLPDTGSMMPDPYTFEIAAVSAETLENITGLSGVVTDIAVKLSDGYTFETVKTALGELIKNYGPVYILPQEDQPSNQMLTMELDSISGMSAGMSGLFLTVAAAILYIMLRRLVEQERTQIGVLKAFGYSNARIISNYMLYGLITGLTGGILGAALGVLASGTMFDMYIIYFSIPETKMSAASGVGAYFIRGVAASVVTGMLAAVLGVLNVLKLSPADSMRPPSPPLIKKSLFGSNSFFEMIFTKRGMMTLRYIERNKFKSLLIVFSVSLSFMLMAMMFSWTFLFDKLMLDQLTKVEKYDMKISLRTPVPEAEAVSGIMSVAGVNYAEGILELSFTFSCKNLSKDATVTGLNTGSPVYKIMDNKDKFYEPPEDGLLITKPLADDLNIKPGGVVTLESPYLKEKTDVRVAGIFDSSLGSGAYMAADSLSLLMNMPPVSNRVVVTSGEEKSGAIKEALIEAENISDISDKEAILKSYQEMLRAYTSTIYMVLAMAILIAFAIIYNVSGVSLSERQRELATMRVLGYGPRETYEILSLENYLLCFAAVTVGIPLTFFGIRAYSELLRTDLFAMPDTIPVMSYVCAGGSCLLAVFLSNMAALRCLKKFSLVAVLKERE